MARTPKRGIRGRRFCTRGFQKWPRLFKTIRYRDPAETLSAEFPVWLTTGRRLQAYHTRTQTGRSQGIDYLLAEERLEVHPEDITAWGLEDGGLCRLSSARGAVEIRAEANTRSPRGTVFASFQLQRRADQHPHRLGYDPVTDTAELKVCPVRVEALVESEVAG